MIGIEVFGRAPDYDTAEDPVVRLRAADIRKRLAQYYQANESAPGDWKIEIPTGSYKAHFRRVEPHSAQTVKPDEIVHLRVEAAVKGSEALPSTAPAFMGKFRWTPLLLGTIVAAAIASVVVTRTASTPKSALDLFWGPVLQNSRPVLVCTGSNRVYRLSEDALARYRKNHPGAQDDTPNLEMLIPKPDLKHFTAEDFLPVKDTYLTIGDASAAAQIATLLTSRRHAFDLRFGSDFSFGDLREGSAVLVGAFNNNWTLNMTDNLRFVFDGGNTPQMHVQDRFDGSRSWWPKFSNGKFIEDWAIVSRILNSKTGSVLVTIGGLDHSGTRAAGNFVSSPQLIADFVKQAPRDWSTKNVQVVLHTNVTDGIPDVPTVIAAYYW